MIKVYSEAKYNPNDIELRYATAGAAAVDIRVMECVRVRPGQIVAARTGLFMEIPEGWAGLIVPRSGLGSKGLVLANTVGLIDSDYRGEVNLMFYNRNTTGKPIHVEEGTRAAQMIFIQVPQVKIQMVASRAELSDTVRGTGGYGSTGVK